VHTINIILLLFTFQ